MRIIGGSAKGRRLNAPRHSPARPTADRVRGALFSILESMQRETKRVLDLYAGTGALGIEALSRDAEWADFVERDARLCSTIKQNLEATGLAGRAHVYCASVEKALGFLKEPYDLVLLDPPYQEATAGRVMDALGASPLVKGSSVVVLEHSKRMPVQDRYGALVRTRVKMYGDTALSFFGQGKA